MPRCEGRHPDHDPAAFAVHAAVHPLRAEGTAAPAVVEFASYHARGGGLATGEFLPPDGVEEMEIVLTDAEREMKERMLACFATQRKLRGRARLALHALGAGAGGRC